MSSPPSANAQQVGEAQQAQFPEIGEVFENRYQVESLLGTGGYAKVYKATQVELGRDVAIKVLSPTVRNVESAQSGEGSLESLMIRFEREAKLVSQLKSPYTVTMYDYGRTDSDLLYMVLEHIDGITLSDAEVPMAPERVAKILVQVLKSLQEAHDAELLHRDLKPTNIMIYEHLGESDHVKLLDFGIAKLIGERHDREKNEQDLTGEEKLLGTPRYMSPEQIHGEEVGPPRDIYSLGLIAYEMLVGEKAIDEDDSIKIMAKHISEEPLRIPPDADVDLTLEHIIDRMLAKDLDERYSSVEEVIEDLDYYERGEPLEWVEPASQTSEMPALDPSDGGETSESLEMAGETKTSTRLTLAVAAVGIVFVVGIAVLVLTSRGEPESVAAESEAAVSTGDPAGPAGAGAADEEIVPPKEPVRITSTPSGATVRIDGDESGTTPLTLSPDEVTVPAAVTVEYKSEFIDRKLEKYGTDLSFEFDLSEVQEESNSPSEAEEKARTDDSPPDDSRPSGSTANDDSPSPSSPTASEGAGDSTRDEPTEPSPPPSKPDESAASDESSESTPSSRTADSQKTGGSDGAEETGGDDDSDDEPEFLPLE